MRRTEAIFANATQGTFQTRGTIVLTHELNNNTMRIFEQEYPTIQRNFQHIEPVHACQNITNPYLEQQYNYPVHSQVRLSR